MVIYKNINVAVGQSNSHRIELKGSSMREKTKQNGPADEPSLGRASGSFAKTPLQS